MNDEEYKKISLEAAKVEKILTELILARRKNV